MNDKLYFTVPHYAIELLLPSSANVVDWVSYLVD
jgi:hypothetical protein